MGWLQRLFGRQEQEPAPKQGPSKQPETLKAVQRDSWNQSGLHQYNRSTAWGPAPGSQWQKSTPQAPKPREEPTAPIKKTYIPSASDRAFLNSMGWQVKDPQPMTVPHESTSFEKLIASPSHTYGLSAEQAMGLQGAVTGMEGFVAPTTPATDTKVTFDVEVGELSWEQYDALTDEQRAAIDHNTRMVEARNKDLTEKPTLRKEDMEAYTSKVNQIFGEGGGSETYAPNLVNLLDEINFRAKGADLDEFLSLERAIDMTELEDFKLSSDDKVIEYWAQPERLVGTGVGVTKVPGTSNYAEARSVENLAVIDSLAVKDSQAAITAAMTDASRVLWDFNSTFKGRDAFDIEDIPYGYGTAQERGETPGAQGLTMDTWTQEAWALLKDPNADPLPAIQEAMDVYAFTPEDKQKFYSQVNEWTKNEMQYGEIGGGGAGLRTPAEIRALLGWKD